ncbi:MAG: tetratricopeptide repeat protein, partial [Phycisphaerales bacterium]|nr:tetratricopeptide repeat protein [Phycisphaerales bacterium]
TPQQVAPFIPTLGTFDAAADSKVQQVRHMLAQAASVHNAATHLIEHEDWDLCCVYLDTIDRFAHAFMEYHPPRMAHVDEPSFERYRDVMTGCYRFHDMMLGRCLDLCGDETAVVIVSDHGFHCDDLRPEGTSAIRDGQPVAWHRPYGMLAIWGPGIRKGERLYGASLLDVCPTILSMLGLPIASDMEGHALTQIFETRPTIETIPTYEDGTRHDAEEAEDPWVARQMLDQLQALGYVESEDVDDVVVDRHRNLGQVYASTGRHALAVEQYREVLAKRPDDKGSKVQIGASLLAMGDLEGCESMLDDALASDDDLPRAHLFKGMIAQRRGRLDDALAHLLEAERHASSAGVSVQIGNVHMQRQRLDEARGCYERALELDRDCAEAFDGLGVVHRLQGRR